MTAKKISFILIACCAALSWAQNQPNAAVIALEARGITSDEALTITDILRSQISRQGYFNLMERNKVDEILKEQGFQQTGCTTSDCYVAMGQMIGVDKLITGSIGKLGEVFIVSLRVMDVATGRIIRDETEKFEGKIEHVIDKTIPSLVKKISAPEVVKGSGDVSSANVSRPEQERPLKAHPEPSKKRRVLTNIIRYGLFLSGAACGVAAFASYKTGDNIYKTQYITASSKEEAERLKSNVQRYDRRANIFIVLSGGCLVGGGMTFVF